MEKELSYVLNYALNRGFQIHPDAFRLLENTDVKKLERIIKDVVKEKTKRGQFQISQGDLEACMGLEPVADIRSEYEILSDPTAKVTTGEGLEGYSALFASRFAKLKKLVQARPEAKLLKTIKTAREAGRDEDVYVCGLVTQRETDRNVTRLVLEDPSGSLEGVIFDKDLQETAGTLLGDQLVMARVSAGKKAGLIIKELVFPGVPDIRPGRSESEALAVFLSDLHIGSKYFMEKEFAGFVSWLSSADPTARRVRFVLIAGDVVDGVGIYPNQDRELVCQTVEEQLEKTRHLLGMIPSDVKIFIMPGNHDPGRRALPQPAIPAKYDPPLWEMENVVMVGNPAVVSLNGVKVLMFHGQSIDDIVKTTPGLSYDSPVDVMRHLLRARHLSPIYGSQTPIAPETEDMLVIDDVPDIFHVGHVHRAQLGWYKGVLLINSGSWQKQTPFQNSVGMVPNPGIAIAVNLKTFKVLHQNYNPDSDNVLQS